MDVKSALIGFNILFWKFNVLGISRQIPVSCTARQGDYETVIAP
jgi:hypothetical protein